MAQEFAPQLELAVLAARQAGGYVASQFGRRVEVRFKGPANPVTEVDLRSQELIRETLMEVYPNYGFLGEEGEAASASSAEWLWIVDPLDGTKNFTHGYPMICVSIGLEYRGQMVVGVVHDPLRQETFAAVRGQGATLNQRPIQTSQEDDLGRALLMTGFAAGADVEHHIFRTLEIASQGVRRDGAAALDLCHLAAGRIDGFWQLNLSPWDVAAGALIVEEAQGMVTDFRGRPFQVRARQLVASNVKLHRAMLDHIARHGEEVERWLASRR